MHSFTSMSEVIEHNEREQPDAAFLRWAGKSTSFADYARRVRQLGSALQMGGARKQDRVAILAMNCAEYAEAYGLADLCGYIMTTVNFRLAGSEIAWILNDAQPSVLIFEDRYRAVVEALLPRIPSVTQFVRIGGEQDCRWARDYEEVLGSGDPAGPSFRASADDYLGIMYTSGTTGRPKGVLCRHLQPLALGMLLAGEYGSAPGTRGLIVLPMFHLLARSTYLAQMIGGGGVLIHRQFDARDVLDSIANEHITVAGVVPTMLYDMLAVTDLDAYDLSSLRKVTTGGANLSLPDLNRTLAKLGPVINVYGTTEGGNTTIFRSEEILSAQSEDASRRIGSLGRPSAITEMRILGEDGNPVASNVPGEICVRTAQVMEGYWNNHAATVDVLRDGWLHTGDLGEVDEDGFLYLLDRKKDMIVSGGENIYSAEVERALILHPAVAEVAVIGVPDSKWGEAVRAVAMLEPGEELTEADLIAFARTQIAVYKCPKSVKFVPEIAKVPTGKVDKVALRKEHSNV